MRPFLTFLPRGTLQVSLGVAVYGLASYFFLALAGHQLQAGPMASLSILWSTVFAITVGVFMPLEQELTRLVSTALANRDPLRPVLRSGAGLVACVVALLLVIAATAQRPVANLLYDGDRELVWATALSLAGYAVAFAVRGVLGGMGKFANYGTGCAIDGAVRVAGAAMVASAAGYAWVLVAAPVLAALATALPLIRAFAGPKDVARHEVSLWRGLLRNTGLLIAAGLITQVMANIAVVNAKLLSPGDAQIAVALLGAMVIVRIPIVVFGSMYSAMLKSVSTSVAHGDWAGFRQTVRRTLAVVTGLVGLVTAGCLALGPQASVLLFNSPSLLTRGDFLILCAGTAAYLWAMVLGQSLLALGGHARQAVCLSAGLVALAIVTMLPTTTTLRVELAYLAGMAVAAGLLLHSTVRRAAALRDKSRPVVGGVPVYDVAI